MCFFSSLCAPNDNTASRETHHRCIHAFRCKGRLALWFFISLSLSVVIAACPAFKASLTLYSFIFAQIDCFPQSPHAFFYLLSQRSFFLLFPLCRTRAHSSHHSGVVSQVPQDTSLPPVKSCLDGPQWLSHMHAPNPSQNGRWTVYCPLPCS